MLIVTLATSFVINLMLKWELLERIEVFQGSKWYIPKWIDFSCLFCITFWITLVCSITACYLVGLELKFIFLGILTHPVSLKLLNI